MKGDRIIALVLGLLTAGCITGLVLLTPTQQEHPVLFLGLLFSVILILPAMVCILDLQRSLKLTRLKEKRNEG